MVSFATPRSLVPILLLVTMALSGCVFDEPQLDPALDGERTFAPMEDIVWDTTKSWSQTVTAPLYDYLEAVVTMVPSFDGTPIQISVFRPAIPGCPETIDAAEAEYPEECKTPVIMDAGPYTSPATMAEHSTRPPTSLWYVPHGYTFVKMAVRGTGGSGGCMELMSENEQRDVDHIVTWLAERPWSTGNIGMMGRSYDGTTPLMPAALGNPHLKTIVPISGVMDMADLMFSNGTSEFRGPIMHSVVYWLNYGWSPEPQSSKTEQVCQELVDGQVQATYTAATGDWSGAGMSDYWALRSFDERILENYGGSVFIVHGMQDWNVNPRMAVPWINQLQDAGIETKAWLGQWGHAYPDRSDEHANTRWDWAETTLRWFERELKGADVDVGPAIEVEDHRHDWWVMDSYPARDLTWKTLFLNGDGTATNTSGTAGQAVIASPTEWADAAKPGVVGSPERRSATFLTEPMDEPVRVSGLVRMDLEVSPMTATGGNLYANLYDVYPDGRSVWIGHAWMNLQYHEGGNEQQTLVPGQPISAKVESEPLEAFLPAGHRIRLTVHAEAAGPNADVVALPYRGPFILHMDGDSNLRLPLVTDFRPSPYDDPST